MGNPTQADIARETGYGRQLVSAVFLGRAAEYGASTEAERIVIETGKRLGYIRFPKATRSDAGKSRPAPALFVVRCIHAVEGGCEDCRAFEREFKRSICRVNRGTERG